MRPWIRNTLTIYRIDAVRNIADTQKSQQHKNCRCTFSSSFRLFFTRFPKLVGYSQKIFQDVDNSLANHDIMGGWLCNRLHLRTEPVQMPFFRERLLVYEIMPDSLFIPPGNNLLRLTWAFEELRLRTVFLRVFADNKWARKSYENAGFRLRTDTADHLKCFIRGTIIYQNDFITVFGQPFLCAR